MKYSAVCCMAKDEDVFIREWIAYHLLLGFDHCIVVDDASSTPIAKSLGDWAPRGLVSIIRHKTPKGQVETYEKCLSLFKDEFFWIAFIDVDEFIRCANPWPHLPPADWTACPDIRSILSQYEPYGALGINWRMFAWSGHDKRPEGPVIANYTHCLGDDVHIKSIVQPRAVLSCANPHAFRLKKGWTAVDPSFFPLSDGSYFTIPHTSTLAINHYYFKSREDFHCKVARGNPVHITRSMQEFEQHINRPTTVDTSLMPYVPALTELLALPVLRLRQETGLVAKGDCQHVLQDVSQKLACKNSSVRIVPLFVQLADICCAYASSEMEQLVALELWFLRAKLALSVNALEFAEHALKQSLLCGASRNAYLLLAELYMKKRDIVSSRYAVRLAQFV